MEKAFKALMWVFFSISGLFTALAILSIHINKSYDVYDPMLLTVSAGLMLVAVLVYTVLPRGKVIPLAAAWVASVMLVIAVVGLGKAFPENADLFREVGLTSWELVWRHYSMLLAPIFMTGSFLCGIARRREEKELSEKDYRGVYDLSGDALFSDSDEIVPQKKKRSVIARERKEQKK
jgi:hypothetical protein